MRLKLRSAAAAVLCLVLVAPASAGAPADPQFKTEIDTLLKHLDTETQGVVHWEGADRIDLRHDGDTDIAEFTNARISLGMPDAEPDGDRTRLVLDHVAVRGTPAPDGGFALTIAFPDKARFDAKGHDWAVVTLDKANARIVIDAKSSRARETAFDFAKARLTETDTGDWIEFGPLSLDWKMIPEGGSGWRSPIDMTLAGVKFFFTEDRVGGAIDKIAYYGQSAGPDLAALNRLRDRLADLRGKTEADPKQRLDEVAELMPALLSQFSVVKGELTAGTTNVRAPDGQPVFAFDKASLGSEMAGLAGDTARWRLKLGEDGLRIAPKLLDPAKVPQHLALELGIENVATKPLRTVVMAAIKARQRPGQPGQELATAALLGAAATLNPVFHIYDLSLDTRDVGIKAAAEAKGSPIGGKGFEAKGDVSVRGFAALPRLLGQADAISDYLPLLGHLGVPEKGADGEPRLAFRLASVPPRWLTINGNDVSAWFAPDARPEGEPRLLRLSRPPIKGAEVDAVQHALAAAGIEAPQTGRYDPATALAVARFQKANGLNIDGVVDAVTRRKLGLLPGPRKEDKSGKGAN